jgi:hypothetical protein
VGRSQPNLTSGHLDGCTVREVCAGPDEPPSVVVVACAEGCPHLTIRLEER